MSDMLNQEIADSVDPAKKFEQNIDAQAPLAENAIIEPVYKMVGDSRIPISKNYGTLWKQRLDAGKAAVKPFQDGWDEATKYYQNDQLVHRTTDRSNSSGNTAVSRRINSQWSETENIVFANIQSVIPAIYAKNPTCEMTRQFRGQKDRPEEDKEITRLETLVNTLANMDRAPGFNLKPVAKQGVVCAKLTNIAWMEIGYTFRSQSSEQAMVDLQKLEKELAEAVEIKDIVRIEGDLMALQESIDLLMPAGPFRRLVHPRDVVIDPHTREPDFSDMRWMAVRDYITTNFLNAKYGKRNAETGKYMSIYKPTHILAADNTVAGDDSVKNFKLITDSAAEPKQFGYQTEEELRNAGVTEVWKIWDKATRRLYMFASNDWTWPVWVWNDPYQLPRFFPFRPLYYNTAAIGAYAKSEVAYYLDQQDAINEINDEWRRGRQQVKRNILYNKKLDKDAIEQVLKGDDGTARGVELPDGSKFEDHFWSPPVNVLKYRELFDKSDKLAAIDRISGVSFILRNEQFKTNTTNEAISRYESTAATRLDGQIDPIEDWLGGIFADLAFLCLRFMEPEMVADVIGPEMAKGWTNLDVKQASNFFNVRIVGGSTLKPTSQAKKREAIEVARVLGQFVQAAPGATMKVILRMFEQSFDGINVESSDWLEITREAEARLQRGGPAGAGEPTGDGGTEPNNPVAAIAARVDQMPPEAKLAVATAIGKAIARGVPLIEAVQEVVANLSGPQTQQ